MNNVSVTNLNRNIAFMKSEKSERKTPPNPTISNVPLRGTKRLNMHQIGRASCRERV